MFSDEDHLTLPPARLVHILLVDVLGFGSSLCGCNPAEIRPWTQDEIFQGYIFLCKDCGRLLDELLARQERPPKK